MSDAYSTDPEEMAPGDAAEPGETSEPGEGAPEQKQSQQEANYREGNPQRSCGLCGSFDSKDHGCDTVEGDISPFGYCDSYERQDNPFREGEKEGFEGGIPVAEDAAAPPSLLTIGRKSYGGEA